jgi:hypothetical protein
MQDKLFKSLLVNISAHVQVDQDAVRKVIAALADFLAGYTVVQTGHQ